MLLPALLLLAQASAPAATPTPAPAAGPSPAFMTAAQTFGQCISRGAEAVPATVAPEAGAKQVVAGCSTQRAALDKEFEAMVGGPTIPAAKREQARAQYQQRMAGIGPQLTAAFAQRGAAPAPAATPTPKADGR